MKFLIIFLAIFTCSCDTSKPKDVIEPLVKAPSKKPDISQKKVESVPERSEAAIAFESMKGDYFGEFVAQKFNKKKSPTMKNKIKFSLEKIDEKTGKIFGSSIVAGGKRPFSGSYLFTGSSFKTKLREPGDNKHDGVFEVNIKAGENQIEGSWIANDKKVAVTERSFKLEKITFKYEPTSNVTFRNFKKYLGKYGGNVWKEIAQTDVHMRQYSSEDFNASRRKLNSKDVENMVREDLSLVRNTIYARHGLRL